MGLTPPFEQCKNIGFFGRGWLPEKVIIFKTNFVRKNHKMVTPFLYVAKVSFYISVKTVHYICRNFLVNTFLEMLFSGWKNSAVKHTALILPFYKHTFPQVLKWYCRLLHCWWYSRVRRLPLQVFVQLKFNSSIFEWPTHTATERCVIHVHIFEYVTSYFSQTCEMSSLYSEETNWHQYAPKKCRIYCILSSSSGKYWF